MTTSKQKNYVLDTNILINFGLFVPLKLNKDFWNKMEATLQVGQWVLLDVVVQEIKYNQELMNWCKVQIGAGRVQKIEDIHRMRAVEINNLYPMIDQTTQKSEADTYILAYAETKELCVFSRESKKDQLKPDALYKIPDVCGKLDISCERVPEKFLTNLGF